MDLSLDLALELGSAALGAPANPELVGNGTFGTDTSGWTAVNATLSVVGGAMRVENTGANFGHAYTPVSLVNGVSYTLTYTKTNDTSGNGLMGADTGPGGITFSSSNGTLVFTATSTGTWYISAYAGGNVLGNRTDYDNISLKRT